MKKQKLSTIAKFSNATVCIGFTFMSSDISFGRLPPRGSQTQLSEQTSSLNQAKELRNEMKWKHHKPVLTFRWPILHGSPIASPLNAILQSLFIAVWDGLRIHGARRGNVFCYVVLCSQALLLSSFSSPCSLSAFALMCSFYFMPKLMSQNENECYIIMCFTRCFANMICNAFLQVVHNMFWVLVSFSIV